MPFATRETIKTEFELAAHRGLLAARRRWRTLPIVAVTAHAFAEDRENALRSGCDAYLAKPVDRARLLSVVQGFTG